MVFDRNMTFANDVSCREQVEENLEDVSRVVNNKPLQPDIQFSFTAATS